MKVCDCEINMANKIAEYCLKEIDRHERMIESIKEKHYKEIEKVGIDTLKRVINKISYLTDKDYV